MKYKVRTVRGKHPLVEVVFEDEQYALAGELLLAERSFLKEMIVALDKVLHSGGAAADTFSGNAFSLGITCETTKITNDITSEEAELPTADLLKMTKAYKKQYDKLQR